MGKINRNINRIQNNESDYIFSMNLDKVSETKNGDEIIGILTHLTDPTQNNTYSDKYFSGIDFDFF